MTRAISGTLASVLFMGALTVAVGCHATEATYARKDSSLNLKVDASATKIVEGQTVTFLSRTENTLNRNAKIDWTTTGGAMKIEDEGRRARVTFPHAGTYNVDGVLSADGHEVDRETTVITVTPAT